MLTLINHGKSKLRTALSSSFCESLARCDLRPLSTTAPRHYYYYYLSRTTRKKALSQPTFETSRPNRSFVSVTGICLDKKASPFAKKSDTPKKAKRKFLPPKAAVELTPKARTFFKRLLENPPRTDVVGIMLNYHQSTSGQPRMVFSFDFITQDQIGENDEGVSLEVLDDGTPKPPKDSVDDGLPKLYISHNGFMKVLGCKLDVDVDNMKPVLYDSSGNVMDPNVT